MEGGTKLFNTNGFSFVTEKGIIKYANTKNSHSDINMINVIKFI